MKKERIIYFDVLNIIAIIAVIFLHCNGIVHGNPNIRAWNTSLIIECVFYFAVPLFCMLTGANLMNYREKYDTKTFFKKRISKVLIPFLIWATIMFIWKIYIIETMDSISNIRDLLNAFFLNKEESTYYFMFNILGIYLTMPILSLLTDHKYRKTLWYTVLLYFIFNSLVPNILSLFNITYNSGTSVLLSGYIIFVILGYLLSTENIKPKHRYLIYIGAIIGIIYRYSTTFILSKNAHHVVKITWGYTSWHSILLASAVFLIIKELFSKKNYDKNIIRILSKISSCSFGIYLIHQIVIYYQKMMLNINTVTWQWRIFGVVSTYLISLLIVYCLKKIPLLKKIVP